MSRIAWRGLLLLAVTACDGSSPRPAPPVYLQPTVVDATYESLADLVQPAQPSATPLLPDWCGAERGALDAAQKIGQISDAYLSAQLATCERLTQGMLADQLASWRAYLYDYTSVMAGCVDLPVPPPGGILKFGPANTLAIGVQPALLSRGDAALLIEAYLSSFASALSLGSDDHTLLEAHLWRTAEPEIDPSLALGLTVCGEAADAGG